MKTFTPKERSKIYIKVLSQMDNYPGWGLCWMIAKLLPEYKKHEGNQSLYFYHLKERFPELYLFKDEFSFSSFFWNIGDVESRIFALSLMIEMTK